MICNDGIDDGAAWGDGDGLVDAADPECRFFNQPALSTKDMYVANAGWRAWRYANEFLSLHPPTADKVQNFMGTALRLNILVERPLTRNGSVLPAREGPSRSFTRRGLHWLGHYAPTDDPAGLHYGDRFTIVLSRTGGEMDRDEGGRGAGILFHEMTHWWVRALAGNFGRGFNDVGAPTGSKMASAVDEGLSYYAASAYLSSPDAVPPPPSPPPGWRPKRETVDFVASYRPIAAPPDVMDRYHLTWATVSPCFERDAEGCSAFASYAGPQFDVEGGVNDELTLWEYCDGGWWDTTVTVPSPPSGQWWNGIDAAASVQAALNDQSQCVGLTAPLPPDQQWDYVVQWHANRREADFQGMRVLCNNCDDLYFSGSILNTLGFPTFVAGPDDDSSSDPLVFSAPNAWPKTAQNPNCTDFYSGLPGAPSWAGSEDENNTTANCDDQTSSPVYFFGDLLAQGLWEARLGTPDPELWDTAVLAAAELSRDCPATDAPVVRGVPDCPEVFLDVFAYMTLLVWEQSGATEAGRVLGIFADRDLQ